MSRWKMEPLQLFDVGNRFKSKAREYFELGNWEYAMNRYEKSLEYFEADEKMDNEEKHQAADYIATVHNNKAMIHLKKHEFLECIRECQKVLKYEETNVKSWCRMGQSRMMLGEYQQASEDLSHALLLDKDNKYIKRMIKTNRKKKRSYNDNQKNLYGGMFDRYNEAMKQKELERQNAPKSLDDVKINVADIDDYDSDDSQMSSMSSIDFGFDDMDEEEAEVVKDQTVQSLESIDE